MQNRIAFTETVKSEFLLMESFGEGSISDLRFFCDPSHLLEKIFKGSR